MRLKNKDKVALKKFKIEVNKIFSEAKFILFGSKATGKDDKFSDIDVMVLLKRRVSLDIEKKIFEIGFEAGLKSGVVFGIVVEESKSLNSPLFAFMPFYQNVAKQGVAV